VLAERHRRSFPLFAERGRYDVRAQAEGRCPCSSAALTSSTRASSTPPSLSVPAPRSPRSFSRLKVGTIAIGGRNYCGLVGHGGSADTDPIVGYVTKLPANGGKLRFISGWRQ
jgi:hypothetical protein